MAPSNYTVLYPAATISSAVARLGKEVNGWAAEVQAGEEDSGTPLLALCVLRGAVHFFSDLTRLVTAPLELAYCSVASYSQETNRQGAAQFGLLPPQVAGRSVLLVDDICDTGNTLNLLSTQLRSEGAVEVRAAVLIHRRSAGSPPPHWCAFSYDGPEWFVGYGLDDKNLYANLPEVYIARSE